MSTIKLLVNRNKQIKETKETIETIFKTLISEVEIQMQTSSCFIMNLSTGVGKSTDFIYELYNHFQYHKVICSQVTVVNTVGISKYVATKPGLSLGTNIGYQAGEFRQLPTQFHSITYQTLKNTTNRYLMPLKEGTMNTPQRYIIVIDEAHINDVNSQEQMAIIRDLLINKSKDQLPFFIIQSASIDVNKYMEYFKLDSYIFAEGTRNPIKELFLDDFKLQSEKSVLKATISVIETIVKSCFLKPLDTNTAVSKALQEIKVQTPSSILVFITKQKQMTDLEKAINLSKIIKQSGLQCVLINALTIQKDDQLISKNDNPTPKIFLSTNVIETGYTIKNISFVIDCMKFKFLYQNPISKVEIIRDTPVDKQMQQQRRGRVGRITPGIYIGICPKAVSDKLIPKKELQVQVNNIQKIIYSVGIEQFMDLQFLSKVPIEHLFDYFQVESLIGKETLDAKNTTLVNTLISSDIYFKDFRQIILLSLAIIHKIRIIDLIFIFSFMFNSDMFKPNRREYVNDFKQMIQQIYTGKYVKPELSSQITQFVTFFNNRGYNIYLGEPWNSEQSQNTWKMCLALSYYMFMFKRKGTSDTFVSKQDIHVKLELPKEVTYFVATNVQLQSTYICKHIIEISKKEWDILPCQ